MKHIKATLPHGIYYEHLETINGVRFTPREVDIIACLLSGKGAKTAAHFLSIEEKTVETHKYNIMRKLECNSKECIINFIEKSDKFSVVKKHYLGLLVQATFEKHLREILTLRGKTTSVCCLVYWREQETVALMNRMERHLKLAGIKILSEVRETHKSLNHLVHHIESQSVEYVIYVPSQTLMTQFQLDDDKGKSEVFPFIQKASKNPGSVIFLLMDRDATIEITQDVQDIGYVCFGEAENYYFSLLDILQRISPTISLEKIISGFKKQYEVIYGSADKALPQLWSEVNEEQAYENLKGNTFRGFLPKGNARLLVGGSVFLGVFCILFLILTAKEDKSPLITPQINKTQVSSMRSDLPLPQDNVFLERPKLISQIKEKLNGQQDIQTLALVGIGGSGKTTLARQYMRTQKSPVIWEINAETKGSLIGSFENLACALSQTEEEKRTLRGLQDIKGAKEREEKLIRLIKERLRSQPNWFLIFDNVEKFTDIQNYFPSDPHVWGKGAVIVTTRDSTIQNNNHITNTIHISELDSKEKLDFFMKIMNHSNATPSVSAERERETQNFLKEIPPFPLDITVAAYYLKLTGISYEKYLGYLKKSHKDFEDVQEKMLKESGNYSRTRYNIITLSLKQLIDTHKDFKDLLLFISMLDSQDIPRALLDSYKDNAIVDNFIYNLKKYSLITTNGSTSSPNSFPSLSIHRSTQTISLDYLVKSLGLEKTNPIILSISDVLENYIADVISKSDYLMEKYLINHCETFLNHTNLLTDLASGAIGGKLGSIYFYYGQYMKSKKILEESFLKLNNYEIKERARIAEILVYLGMIYRKIGNYEKSKDLTEQSLEIYKKYLPNKHLEFCWSVFNLGIIYRNLGDFEKSKNLFEQSLIIYRKYFDKDYIWIARSLAHLGNVYRNLGNYKEAENFLNQSLMIYKKNLPDRHIEIAWPLMHLGNVYRSLGNYKEAENLLMQSLMILKEYFGKNHISFVWCLGYLGKIYRDLGHYEKAKDLFQETLIIFDKNIYKNHVRRSYIAILLGKSYRDLGYYEKARDLFQESLIVYENHFGKTHVCTAWVLECLGEVYKDLGNFEKAKSFFEQILGIYEKEMDKDHLKTARVLNHLGQVYFLEGHLEDAEKSLTKALEIFQKNKHPESYKALENLAELSLKKALNEVNPLQGQTFKIQATDYLKQAHAIAESSFPQESPHVIRIKSNLKTLEVRRKNTGKGY